MNKKISSLLMAATMSATAVTPAFASDIHVTEAGGTGNSKVTFEVVNTGSPEDPTIFSAYVPAILPIKMDLDGNITVPTNTVIRNGVANKAIQVEAATVTTTGDWEHTDMTAAENGVADSHLLGLELNGQDLTNASFPWKIEAADSLDLNMQAVIPQQTKASVESEIATIGFTLDWADDKLHATNEIDKATMDAALKNLTGKLIFTTSAYMGEGGIDISKNDDGSVFAVVNGQDATVYSEGGVLGIDTPTGTLDSMFCDYRAKEMDLHGLDTSKMKNMYYMFAGCEFQSINLSSFDTKNVTNMNRMFAQCEFVKSLDLSNFITNNVTDMGTMFSNCFALTKLNLSSFDTKNVSNMESMFNRCKSLTTLNLLSFETNNVTDMHGIFYKCSSLAILDLSSVDMSNVTNTNNMFEDCISLKTCYAKTQEDCNRLNNSSYKPSNVNFVVKPNQ